MTLHLDRKVAANMPLAQLRIMGLIEHSTSHQLCGVLTVLCSEIRCCVKRQTVIGHPIERPC
jgi:hypothetical protein